MSGFLSHRAPDAGCAKYIGRVGALAVAMGLGAAIANSPGIALADTGTSAQTDSSAEAGPAAASTSESTSTPSTTSSSNSPETPAGSSTTESTDDPPSGVVQASGGANTTVTGEKPKGASHKSDTSEQPSTAPHRKPALKSETTVTRTVATTEAEPESPGTHANSSPEPTMRMQVQTTSAPVQPVSPSISTPPPPVGIVTGLVSSLLSWVGLGPQASSNPVAPPGAPTLWAVLGWVRREVEYTLFNQTPTMAYKSTENSQAVDGVVSGDLHASDADGDTLTYTVTSAPQRGTVAVKADGTFTYTPNATLASAGGTDTFTVSASDVPGNPFHIHGLNTLLAPDAGSTATTRVTVLVNPLSATSTSPLATADQLAAEQLVDQVVNNPIVWLAKQVLRARWLAAAQQQFALVGGPDEENLAQLDKALDEYVRQAAMEVLLLDPNNPKVLQQVMPPHTWYGQTVGGTRIVYDNPDTIYRFIPVNNASSYVITGRFAGAIPADTNFSVLTGLNGATAANLNGKDLIVAPDGMFTITLDSSPGVPGENHLQLPSGATLILARNTLSDWNAQDPMSLSVERVGGPPDSFFSQIGGLDIPLIGPLVSGNPLLLSLVSVIPAFASSPPLLMAIEAAAVTLIGPQVPDYMALATTDSETGQLRPPNEFTDPAHNAAFLATQLQSVGYFQLTDQQALVLTIDPGNADYFSVPVTNDWTITDNYWDEQTSLNNAQAIANADGTYTIVVSPTDPEVANWVSTGGLNQGTISIRFQHFDSSSTASPTVSSQVVSIDQLGSIIPADQFVTPAEREAQLALRKSGFNKRFAPYPQA
ncbi:Ig-like domain-containing protein [Mycobacterium sp.]|uniref:Ig-like domain-containing protein n=1 Tax=Mycobacterium sp. TaxID=1785 RepID=UPI002C161D7A|nr:Ig-like domain-containing protein [Mycobacterium sp.]HKP42564.1 Ig-like domain-containing protein [Mycobacterium sp.]